MNKAMPTAPSAPMLEDQHLVGHYAPPPPPTYEQAMAQQPMGFVPPAEPAPMAPYPPQNYVAPAMMPQAHHVGPTPQPVPVIPAATTTVIVAGAMPLGPKPATICCPVCHANVKTTTVSEFQAGAHLACIVICLLGCWFCSCLPYCFDSCKDVRHTCPNCNSNLGTYRC